MAGGTYIDVVLVDDHPLVRDGVKYVLSQTNDIHVVGDASTAKQGLALLSVQHCDVALIDIALPDQSGLALQKSIASKFPAIRNLMLSSFAENEYALVALRDGAAGYVMKTAASEELAIAIRIVAAGGQYLSPRMIEKLGRDWIMGGTGYDRPLFSPRENQILQMLANGKRLTEIGNELHLSIKTVSTYRTRILEKAGIRNNAELVKFALTHGIVS
jgi:two-component system, NarL family, invasion response regulator UvrY